MRQSQVYRHLDRCAAWLLPPRCVLCQRPGQAPARDLCADCEVEMPRVMHPCLRCGLPRAMVASHDGDCTQCRAVDLPFARCLAPWAYEFPVMRLVQAFKYEGALAHARIFGTLIASEAERTNTLAQAEGALLVPMPLHVSRLVERGFNQSREIARVVARQLDLPLAESALRRVRATAPQVGLARAARAANLQGAFVADARTIAGRPVILVDDVVTTGSTAIAAAAQLMAAKAATVQVWAVARALA